MTAKLARCAILGVLIGAAAPSSGHAGRLVKQATLEKRRAARAEKAPRFVMHVKVKANGIVKLSWTRTPPHEAERPSTPRRSRVRVRAVR